MIFVIFTIITITYALRHYLRYCDCKKICKQEVGPVCTATPGPTTRGWGLEPENIHRLTRLRAEFSCYFRPEQKKFKKVKRKKENFVCKKKFSRNGFLGLTFIR